MEDTNITFTAQSLAEVLRDAADWLEETKDVKVLDTSIWEDSEGWHINLWHEKPVQ